MTTLVLLLLIGAVVHLYTKSAGQRGDGHRVSVTVTVDTTRPTPPTTHPEHRAAQPRRPACLHLHNGAITLEHERRN